MMQQGRDHGMSTLPRSRSPSPTRREIHGFTRETKDLCWRQCVAVQGRDPSRWRFDAAGNLVCRALRNCIGPLCVEFDHIHPISKGGTGDSSNCQVLQHRVNKLKGNKYPSPNMSSLIQYSDKSWIEFTNEDLDAIELAVYGDISRDGRRSRKLIKREPKPRRRLCVVM